MTLSHGCGGLTIDPVGDHGYQCLPRMMTTGHDA